MIEKYTHESEGYNPFLIRPQWQVAVLNYAPAESLEAIDRLDVHHRTDEAFVLLAGEVVLIAAAVSDGSPEYYTELLKPGIVYNIPAEVWHKVAMKPGSSVLIIENPDTHLGDFEYYYLDDAGRKALAVAVEEAYNRQ